MATNAFNRYNTVPALLAYLNKQQRKQFTDSFDVTNLVQTSNYFEKLSIASTIDNIELLSNKAFLWSGNIITQNGNIITLDNPQSYMQPPFLIFFTESVDIINNGHGVYTIPSDVILYSYQDKYFTRISEDTYLCSDSDIPTGTYNFTVFMKIIDRVGDNFTTDIIQPPNLPQEVSAYANQLTP